MKWRILKRITFYDIDSRPTNKNLTDRDKHLYLRQIQEVITYFRRAYQRAHVTVDIAGLGPEDAAHKVKEIVSPSCGR